MQKSIEINEFDLEEIARQIKEGYTSGINDNGIGHRIVWEIKIDKFKH